MATVFPSQGAEMSFEHERYPIYTQDDSLDDVIKDQQRILDAALKVRSMQVIQGALMNMGQNFDPIGRAVVELLVDTSGNPELRTMLNAVRRSSRPLDIRVFAHWTVTRSEPHWLALLYMNLEHDDLGVAKYHLAFDLRDPKHRTMMSQIERTHKLTIVDADGIETPIYQIAPMPTSALDLASGKSRAGVVERLRGLMLEVPSTLISAFSYSDLFKLAVMHAPDLDTAWPRLAHFDSQLSAVEHGGAFAPPPLDEHEALIGMLGVLQTWTRDMRFHPHVHYLVPAIARASDGTLRRPRNPAFLVAAKPLAVLFRAKLRAALQQTDLYQSIPRETWQQLWVVDCRPVGSGAAALKYLAPYIFRVARANNRIVGVQDDHVTFRYRDGTTKQMRTTTLSAFAFIGRFMQHVLPKGFVKVRYYGLFRLGNRRLLAQVRAKLVPPESTGLAAAASAPAMPAPPAVMRCPRCGKPMQLVQSIPRQSRAPPTFR